MAWDESAICSDNQSFGGKGAPKTGDDYAAAPNVDHTKDFVRKVSGSLSLVYKSHCYWTTSGVLSLAGAPLDSVISLLTGPGAVTDELLPSADGCSQCPTHSGEERP